MSVSPPLTNGAGRSKDFGIRLVLTALVLMGGLAAVLVTEARTPHHSGWTAYAPIGNVGYGVGGSASRTVANLAHQEQVNIGRASCVLSWTNGGGIALCTDPSSGLAAGSRHLDGSPSASRASGSRTADLRAPGAATPGGAGGLHHHLRHCGDGPGFVLQQRAQRAKGTPKLDRREHILLNLRSALTLPRRSGDPRGRRDAGYAGAKVTRVTEVDVPEVEGELANTRGIIRCEAIGQVLVVR